MASYRKRGNSYEVNVSCGRDPVTHKKLFKTATFKPDPEKTEAQNKKDLEYFMADFERSVHAGGNVSIKKTTFSDFVPIWREEYARFELRQNTIESYDQILNDHVIPEIGRIRLTEISPLHLNKLYRKLSETRKDGKKGGYPAGTIKRVHGVIGSIMAFAYKSGVIDSNPCSRATLPKDSKKELTEENYFDETQAAAFVAYLGEPFTVERHPKNRKAYTEICTVPEKIQIFLTMAVLTGCRRSELIALQWSDIDFEKKELTISKATTIAQHQLITDDPKTTKSHRKLSLSDPMIEALREYRTHQLQERLRIGSKWHDNNYVFTTWDGGQMRPETPYSAFKRILKRYNDTHDDQLPDITLHGLRHTSASLLIAENVDLKTVSSRLGHSRIATTLDVYSHAIRSKDKAAADTLSDLIYKNTK